MKIKSVIPPDQGVNKYQPIDLIDDKCWSDTLNVNFGVGYMKKVTGWYPFDSQLASLNSPIKQIDNYYKFNGNEWLIFCTDTGVYWYNPSLHQLLPLYTGLTTTIDQLIMTENFDNNFIVTNGVDKPIYWDGIAPSMSIIPGMDDMESGISNFKGNCVINYSNFLSLVILQRMENIAHKESVGVNLEI
jgi:hypothetical protein